MSGETSEAEVVQTDSGREVRMSYHRGCHGYAVGFASAFFMTTTVLGFVILWKDHVPETVFHLSVVFFIVYSLAGFGIIGIAYTIPVWFYELMEGESDDE
ncbi:hypothetical protein [Haloparvum sp. AD34]